MSVVCGYAQNTQTADSAYSRPLIDVLHGIEKQFNITIKYDAKMIDAVQRVFPARYSKVLNDVNKLSRQLKGKKRAKTADRKAAIAN